jgi:hypothetical protein
VNSAVCSRVVPLSGIEQVGEVPLQSSEESHPENVQPTGAVAVTETLAPETYVA